MALVGLRAKGQLVLVMVGGDGGGRGRATVQMPRLLQFYYKVGAGGVWATVEV